MSTNFDLAYWQLITLVMLGGAIGSSYRVSTSNVSNLFFAIFSARTHANLFCLLQDKQYFGFINPSSGISQWTVCMCSHTFNFQYEM